MRIFIAVLLEPNIKRALTEAQKALRQHNYSGNYTDERNLHLTLSFIGEYNDPDAVLDAMEAITFSPCVLIFNGYIGNFGDLLWAGTEPCPALEKYTKQLRHALAERSIPFDKKKFHPHVTLLRSAASRQPFSDISITQESMTVQRISLMRSDFGKHGAQYTEIDAVEYL